MTERDPEKSGLVTIFNPWESGHDDSSNWDDALARVRITKLSKFERLDIIAIDGKNKNVLLMKNIINLSCRFNEDV